MLRRLVKYDMRAIARIALPLYMASGIISLLCCGVLYFTFGFAEEIDSFFSAILITGGLYAIAVLTIIAMAVVMGVVVIARYYRAVFTDEGYLNLVIPVSRRRLLSSKIASSVIWVLLSAIVAVACLVVSVLLPTLLYDTSLISEAIDLIRAEAGIDGEEKTLLVYAFCVRLAISLCDLIKDVMLVITAITVGSAFFKRFRICACILLYLGISLSEQAVFSLMKAIVAVLSSSSAWVSVTLNAMLELALIFVTFTVGYFISAYALEKKLDLE